MKLPRYSNNEDGAVPSGPCGPCEGGISKRDFLKCSLLGLGGLALGLGRGEALAAPYYWPENLELTPAFGDIWKYSKEATFQAQTPLGVQCKLCPRGCLPKEGELTRCRSRTVKDGKLYSLGYGNPCAVHVDPAEKKPLNHFLPTSAVYSVAVAGCVLTCQNCQNWQVSQFSPKETQNYHLPPEKVVEEALRFGCQSVAFTYSEPTTFYEYAYDTAVLARKKGLKTIWKSCGMTNDEPIRRLAKHLSATNIDLKSLDDDIYQKLNTAFPGALDKVKSTMKIMKEEGVWLEILNLVVPTWVDNLEHVKRMCGWLLDNGFDETPLHFARFRPLYKLQHLPPTSVSFLEDARETAMKAGMQFVYIGNVPGHPGANTYCPKCEEVLIERKGFKSFNVNLNNGKCGSCGKKIPGVWPA